MGTLNDLMLEFYGTGGAIDGTLQDRQIQFFKQVCDAFSIPYPSNAGLSDLAVSVAAFVAMPQTTVNEILRQVWIDETVTPVPSDVWNDVAMRYFVEQT